MLTKLMKYDFKAIFKTLAPIFLVTVLLALFSRFAIFLSDKISLLELPAGLIVVLSVIMIFGLPFVAFIVGINKYYSSIVKDEGYLTHTLPVKKTSIVLSKLITSTVAMLAALVVSIISVFVGYNINSEIMDAITVAYNEIMKYDKWIILLMTISVFVSYICNVLLMYTSISLGQKHNGNKIGYSIVYGIVLYNINQIISSLLLFVPALFNKKYLEYFNEDLPSEGFINGFMIYAIVISIIIAIAYYLITTRSLEKKLNLD